MIPAYECPGCSRPLGVEPTTSTLPDGSYGGKGWMIDTCPDHAPMDHYPKRIREDGGFVVKTKPYRNS